MSNLARKIQKQDIEQPKRFAKSTVRKSLFTKGEKVLYVLFASALCFFSVKIISNQANIYEANKDIQVLESNISDQQKVTEDLQAQVDEYKEYGRVLEAAKEQGLTMNEENVKVVSP